MTLWSIARSPLIMGGDLRALDEATLALLANDEVLAVNQHSEGGREAYRRYSRTALAKVQGVGGRVELLAAAQVALIAPADEQWDELLLVRYPSKAAFLGMLADPEYRAATVHRTAALADSRLIGCLPPG